MFYHPYRGQNKFLASALKLARVKKLQIKLIVNDRLLPNLVTAKGTLPTVTCVKKQK